MSTSLPQSQEAQPPKHTADVCSRQGGIINIPHPIHNKHIPAQFQFLVPEQKVPAANPCCQSPLVWWPRSALYYRYTVTLFTAPAGRRISHPLPPGEGGGGFSIMVSQSNTSMTNLAEPHP